MKIAVNIARIIVGVLFIFSGLVKANDPLGLSYKMQEFFELWGMTDFNSSTLALSVCMNAFEIIAGFALLLGWQTRLFSWLLLLLIIFFTFLTGYAHISGKFQNCGCFGDCIPISTKSSFVKDLALLVLIGFLFSQRHHIRPVFRNKVNTGLMILVALLSFAMQFYTLRFLPFVDCLPYKKGKNISEQMKIPAGSRPDSFAIRFVYSKNGKEFEFSPAELPGDLATYKFISRKDKLIRKGNADAPIKGFMLSGESDADSTNIVLDHPYTVLLFTENLSVPVAKWEDKFIAIYEAASKKNIPVYLITTERKALLAEISNTVFASVPVFKCDFTAIRTAARSNPVLFILKSGTIIAKWSYPDMGAAQKLLASFPAQPSVNVGNTIPNPDSTSH